MVIIDNCDKDEDHCVSSCCARSNNSSSNKYICEKASTEDEDQIEGKAGARVPYILMLISMLVFVLELLVKF